MYRIEVAHDDPLFYHADPLSHKIPFRERPLAVRALACYCLTMSPSLNQLRFLLSVRRRGTVPFISSHRPAVAAACLARGWVWDHPLRKLYYLTPPGRDLLIQLELDGKIPRHLL